MVFRNSERRGMMYYLRCTGPDDDCQCLLCDRNKEIATLKEQLEASENALKYWNGIKEDNIRLKAKIKRLESELIRIHKEFERIFLEVDRGDEIDTIARFNQLRKDVRPE
jgi:hypothetical protein